MRGLDRNQGMRISCTKRYVAPLVVKEQASKTMRCEVGSQGSGRSGGPTRSDWRLRVARHRRRSVTRTKSNTKHLHAIVESRLLAPCYCLTHCYPMLVFVLLLLMKRLWLFLQMMVERFNGPQHGLTENRSSIYLQRTFAHDERLASSPANCCSKPASLSGYPMSDCDWVVPPVWPPGRYCRHRCLFDAYPEPHA